MMIALQFAGGVKHSLILDMLTTQTIDYGLWTVRLSISTDQYSIGSRASKMA